MLSRDNFLASIAGMSVLAELLAVVAPPGCPACRRALVRADERLCAACVRALPWLRPGACGAGCRCTAASACPAAARRVPARVGADGLPGRRAASWSRALKFRAALPVADLMAAHMAANLPAALRGLDAVLVPVPPQRARRRARGFDPARELTRALARRLSRPVATASCARTGPSARSARGGAPGSAAGRIVVRVRGAPPPLAMLVDDVHTTGATLDACARALVAEGVRVVAAISYARTL